MTCCTDDVVNELSRNSVKEFHNNLEQYSSSLKSMFKKKHKKFDSKLLHLVYACILHFYFVNSLGHNNVAIARS